MLSVPFCTSLFSKCSAAYVHRLNVVFCIFCLCPCVNDQGIFCRSSFSINPIAFVLWVQYRKYLRTNRVSVQCILDRHIGIWRIKVLFACVDVKIHTSMHLSLFNMETALSRLQDLIFECLDSFSNIRVPIDLSIHAQTHSTLPFVIPFAFYP